MLQLVSATFLNGTTSASNLKFGNIGTFAQRIDTLTGAGAITAKGFPANYFRPNPQFGPIFFFDSGGDSYYHGGFISVRRRFEKGLDFGLTYTLSKSIYDMSADPPCAATGGGVPTPHHSTLSELH